MTISKLQQALQFLAMGIGIIPLYHRNKKPETGLIGGTWEQYSVSLSSVAEVSSWLMGDWRNYGVVAGWNNLVVIDFDNIEFFNVWKLWADDHEYVKYVIDNSFKVTTSRGIHVYVTTMEPVANEKRICKSGGIDIQAQRKFVVGPGSIHPSGHVYQALGDMVFPVVFDGIESILPLDLFPRVAHEIESGSMPAVEIPQSNTEYDAFASASFAGGEVDLITKVKSMVRIENLFQDVHKTSNDGRWFAARCPFHNDSHPSLWIDARRQICGCQVCNMKPMDAINLFSRMHNIPESIAVTQLAQAVGVWG